MLNFIKFKLNSLTLYNKIHEIILMKLLISFIQIIHLRIMFQKYQMFKIVNQLFPRGVKIYCSVPNACSTGAKGREKKYNIKIIYE